MRFSSHRQRGVSRRRFLSLGIAGVAGTVLADTAWYEPQALQVEKNPLPSGAPGGQVRLLQISDERQLRQHSFGLRPPDRGRLCLKMFQGTPMDPGEAEINATVVSNNSGVHLVAEFIVADTTVTQSDGRGDLLSARQLFGCWRRPGHPCHRYFYAGNMKSLQPR